MELKKYKLGELADFYGGVAYKPSDITNEGIRIIRGGNIQNGVILEKADDVFLPLSYANPENQIHIYDTIIVSSTGSIDALAKAATCFEEMPGTQIGAFLRIIRPKDKKNAMLISAWCTSQHFRDYMINCAKGTSINNIRTDFLENYELVVPSDENVRGLSSLYFNIERKLYLNRQINTNLEALARQLYDYWFVQFDFPDANGKPYKSSGGKMTYNEKLKREIPEGWEVKKVGDKMRIFTGKKDVSKAIPGDYKFFSCAPDPVTSNEYIYDGAAVLVSGNGSYTGRVTYYNGKFDLYQRTYACVMEKMPESIAFFYYTLKYLFQPVYSGGKHGSSIPYIVLGDLADFIYAFDSVIVEDFNKRVKSIFDLHFKNMEEITSLTRQRDELLPLLMNGQVSVE